MRSRSSRYSTWFNGPRISGQTLHQRRSTRSRRVFRIASLGFIIALVCLLLLYADLVPRSSLDIITGSTSYPALCKDANKEHSADFVSDYGQCREDTKCALLFFGLVKGFRDVALPSIQRNIIEQNKHCDVYLHTYNLTEVPVNARSEENQPATLNVGEAYLLTGNVTIENMDSFYSQRQDILNHTRKNYCVSWGTCCGSHDNMIKQWHSIDGVWNAMLDTRVNYQQVGLFRSDVYYTKPIDIFDAQAAFPNFAHHGGYNDRFFYGRYNNAKIWANRFDFIDTFERKYIMRYDPVKKNHNGYHSEIYLKRILDHYKIKANPKSVCVWRIRTGPRLRVDDCFELAEFNQSNFERRLPPGFRVSYDDSGKVFASK